MKNAFLSLLAISLVFSSCTSKEEVDLIVSNGVVYTVDDAFSVAESFAIKNGKIVAIGTTKEISKKYESEKNLDAEGKAIYPGFIDAHSHFYGYGKGLNEVDLRGTKSYDEVIERLITYTKKNTEGWIFGRGWDQNQWPNQDYPDKQSLDNLFATQPVVLTRIDGHAALVNTAVLNYSGIKHNTRVKGGEIKKKKGLMTGVLIDNAMNLIKTPEPSDEQIARALLAAQDNCFAVGLTSVTDAGLRKRYIETIDRMHKDKELLIKVYAMVDGSDEKSVEYYLEQGPYESDKLTVRSIKMYLDGALGSRGALLHQHYTDSPRKKGNMVTSKHDLEAMARKAALAGFQLNTHCIGDSANSVALNVYGKIGDIENRRWRIEHAQILLKKDLKKFADNKIIPSVQPSHATSDKTWAKERLGINRIKNAYTYKDLIDATGLVALGTDFPVEDINPLRTFYAAVARKDVNKTPAEGFQMENALSREQALRGMTIWAAYASFEDNKKGSIEVGKEADFVILSKDIMKVDIDEVLTTKVKKTYLNGQKVY